MLNTMKCTLTTHKTLFLKGVPQEMPDSANKDLTLCGETSVVGARKRERERERERENRLKEK